LVISKNISSLISNFKEKLLAFLLYLERKSDSIEKLDEPNNEIGDLATAVNKNIEKIKNTIEQDNELLQNADEVISKVKRGWYSNIIDKSTTNEPLNNFKNNVNDMIHSIKEHFTHMNVILEQYAHYDYRKKLTVNDIENGGVFELLVTDINKLRDAITSMLVENKQNGMILDKSSSVLLDNVNNLNKNSIQSSKLLDETSFALNKVTANIESNTQKVAKMTKHGNEVKASVSKGQNLANQTTVAMNEIDREVNAINEAISVIDQIAFQTNILSLNAAVEAATAGEAGKGFAVVAQEVRNLANRSAEASKNIADLVKIANEKAIEGKDTAQNMSDGYKELTTNIDDVTKIIKDVSNSSIEQIEVIQNINNSMDTLSDMSNQNATVANSVSDISNDVLDMAQNMLDDAKTKKFNQ
jgi:methyl-accepting chemotaxis protein